jgi:hypothetical protein
MLFKVDLLHTVDDCPLHAGTAEEVALYRQRRLRRRRDTERPETYVYAFTEMLVLEFEGENEKTSPLPQLIKTGIYNMLLQKKAKPSSRLSGLYSSRLAL